MEGFDSKYLNNKDNSRFGGYVYEGDFYCGYNTMVTMAERIECNFKFDRNCRRYGHIRERSLKKNIL